MKPIEMTFDYTQQDYEAFIRDYAFETPLFRKQVRQNQITLLIAFVLVWLAIWYFFFSITLAFTIIYALLAVLWIILAPRRIKKYTLKNLQKHIADSSHQKAFGICTYRFEDEEILDKNPLGESKWPWHSVERIISTKDYFHVILAGDRGLPIPRAQVPPETLRELQTAIEEKLQKGGAA